MAKNHGKQTPPFRILNGIITIAVGVALALLLVADALYMGVSNGVLPFPLPSLLH